MQVYLGHVQKVAYAVMQQPPEIKGRLIKRKSKVSKKQITIPRQKLVAGEMMANTG